MTRMTAVTDIYLIFDTIQRNKMMKRTVLRTSIDTIIQFEKFLFIITSLEHSSRLKILWPS